MEAVATVIGAFFLFLAGIPLIGAGAGLLLRVLLPYLFGGELIYLTMKTTLAPTGAWWELAVPFFAWAALVLGTRLLDNRRHAWYEGHWRAVILVLSFGLWRKAQLPAESFKTYEFGAAAGD
ncbi:MAG: hypothetical protein RQ754_04865 [Desulfuromonadales bacterium]|jgi:hypothetical protein|nr:hypothetical protein [Desulfuromonadales bacterium]